ncbi:hypothetical protein [Saccharothrix algeriensis]|uniref:Uncharacterized protein n=1 Tax=Saccharothrix algeriensis TaxID=173560 RepID=A0ABS2SCN2_9PSEU|nr:hypothetical protein [Saccharothrix algeriensis]MBM7813565.1 hypothetical protein [Saccharothrix algeriensis]
MPEDLTAWLDDLVDTLDPPPPRLVEQVHVLLLLAGAFPAA